MSIPPNVERSRKALEKSEERLIERINKDLKENGSSVVYARLPPGYASKCRKAGYQVEYYGDGGTFIKPRSKESCVIL